MARFTPKQGRYLAFIHAYTNLHGIPPAESEIAAAMSVAPPSVNQMMKTLEKKGLILRQPGKARAVKILVPDEEIPDWNGRKSEKSSQHPATGLREATSKASAPPANLYVLTVILKSGPISEKASKKAIYRIIEIRGDQTLADLHEVIFEAFDRDDEHLYQFQLGKRPHDPKGPNYGIPSRFSGNAKEKNAKTTKLDDLALKPERVFGYWFDFGDDWFHQIQVDKIEEAIPTVPYPRITKRVGKSPPQYSDVEDE